MSRLAILVATSLGLWMALAPGLCLADPPQGMQSRLEIVDGSKVEPIRPELVGPHAETLHGRAEEHPDRRSGGEIS